MENFAELIQRLLEIQSGGRPRSPKVVAEDEILIDRLQKRDLTESSATGRTWPKTGPSGHDSRPDFSSTRSFRSLLRALQSDTPPSRKEERRCHN